jgi:hypothetical protein
MVLRQSIYGYGERVFIGADVGKIEATVLGVEMRGPGYQRLQYLVTWWDDKTRKTEWLDAIEVEAVEEGNPRAAIVHEQGGAR